MFFLVQVDKHNLPRYLFLLLLGFAPLLQGGVSRFPVMVMELLIAIMFLIFWLANLSKQPKVTFSVIDFFLFAFLITSFGSYTFAPYKHDALRAILLIISYIILYYIIIFTFSRSSIRHPMVILILSAMVQGIIGLFQYYFLGVDRVAGTFVNANFYAGFLLAILPISLGEFLCRRHNPLWYISNLIILSGIVLSGSRGAGIVLLIIGIFLLSFSNFFNKKTLILFLLSLIIIVTTIPNPLMSRILTASKNDVYAYSRFSIWKSASNMIMDYWKTGIGLGQYRYISTAYSFPVARAWARYSRIAEYAHNEYLQLAAESGLISLLLVLMAIVWFGYDAIKQIKFQRFTKEEHKNIQVLLLAGILSIFVHALVDFNLHIPSIVLVLVTFGALFRILNQRPGQGYLSFVNRKFYRIPIILIITGYTVAAIRPCVGYYFFQKVNLNSLLTDNIHFLKKAIEIDFLCASYHNSLGGAYFAKYGESRNIIWLLKGIQQAELAAKLNTNDYRFPRSLGDGYYNIYAGIDKSSIYLDYAKAAFLKSLQLAPYDYRIYNRLASIEFYLGRIDQAREYMVKALELEPNYLRGHYQLALIKEKLGDIKGSAEEYNKIEKIRQMKLEKKISSDYEAELLDFDYSSLEKGLRGKETI